MARGRRGHAHRARGVGDAAVSNREVIVSPFAPGSGRKRDYTWPDWNTNMNGAATNVIRDRIGDNNTTAGAIQTGVGAVLNIGIINATPTARFINTTLNTGAIFAFDQGGRCHPRLTQAGNNASGDQDDYSAYRLYAIMRAVATPTSTSDNGLQLQNSGNAAQGIMLGNIPGFAINYDNAGGLTLFMHGNTSNVNTVLRTVADGFLNTDFHTLEMRLLSATAASDAVLKVLIDNVVKFTGTWGAGSNFPTPNTAGGNVNNGFTPTIQCQGAGQELDVALFRCQWAPTETALL